MLIAHQLIFHNFMLLVQFKHLLVVLLKGCIKHAGEHILLDQRLLLICWLLLFQRFKLFTLIILGPLDEVFPYVSLLVKTMLVLS